MPENEELKPNACRVPAFAAVVMQVKVPRVARQFKISDKYELTSGTLTNPCILRFRYWSRTVSKRPTAEFPFNGTFRLQIALAN